MDNQICFKTLPFYHHARAIRSVSSLKHLRQLQSSSSWYLDKRDFCPQNSQTDNPHLTPSWRLFPCLACISVHTLGTTHRRDTMRQSCVICWICLLWAFLLIRSAESKRSLSTTIRLPTPPMGWSTWESFAKNVTEKGILDNLKILEHSGLKVKGYNIIQIDDGWQKLNRTSRWISRVNYDTAPRNKAGPSKHPGFLSNLPPGCTIPDPIKFPRGMKSLGVEIKRRGFRFGLYTSGENFVCDSVKTFRAVYASSAYMNLRSVDAQCLVDWGIDLLKLDMCRPPSFKASYSQQVIRTWRRLLPDNVILYNSRYGCLAKTSCGGDVSVYKCPLKTNWKKNNQIRPYCTQSCDIARLGPDMKPEWRMIVVGISVRIGRGKISKPGFWSDPDYLVPHEDKLSFQQIRSQFGAWCILSAPLLISVDLTKSSPQVLALLGNPEAIRINQAYSGDAGDLIKARGPIWTFGKRLSPTEYALFIINVGPKFARAAPRHNSMWRPGADFSRFAGSPKAKLTQCSAKDVWTSATSNLYANTTMNLQPMDSALLILSGCV